MTSSHIQSYLLRFGVFLYIFGVQIPFKILTKLGSSGGKCTYIRHNLIESPTRWAPDPVISRILTLFIGVK